MQHLFKAWPEAAATLKTAPGLLLMLDFDGTLAPLVPHPDLAALPEKTKLRMEQLAAAAPVDLAVISGRAVSDLRARIGLEGIEYSGNHGRERLRPFSDRIEFRNEVLEKMAAAARAAAQAVDSIEGAYVEDKGLTAALHYRQVPPARHADVRRAVEALIPGLGPGIHVEEGKMVFELLPSDGQNKGKLALTLFQEKGAAGVVVPIYCGDDVTDETVFEALPREALSIHVGNGGKPSRARYRLDDPEQVAEFLGRIVDFLGPRRVEPRSG